MTIYDLLRTIYDCGENSQYVEIINALATKGCEPWDGHRLLKKLLNDGFIEGELDAYRTISLTPKGLARLQELENSSNKSRKIVSEKKKNNIFQVLLVLLGGAITLFIEHFPAIIEFISSLLH